MKKLFLVLLAFVTVYSCQKKELDVPQEVEVVFGIDNIDPTNGLKSPGDWICPTDPLTGELLEPTKAFITITDGITTQYLNPAVFRLDGKLYSQAIKLVALDGSAKTYSVTEFLLQDDLGTTIMATPATGSDYSEYVSQGVPFEFTVNAFEKAEVPVEVLCYFPETHDFFGFTWFEVTEIVIREFCFYGDICLNGEPYGPDYYEGSLYGNGLGVDVPAIMEIVVKRDGVLVPNNDLFNNEATLGIGAPLCVQYPDRLNVTGEVFTFELYIWTPDCNGVFDYRLFHTFTTIDEAPIPDVDNDGVTDFVVGSCNLSATDLQLQHFTWLVISDLWDENNPNGFLYTSDPTTGALWKWQRPDGAAAHNITEPMAFYLNLAGFPEIAGVAFDAIWWDLDNGERFWSTTLSGLMGGYMMTADSKYLTMANSIMDAVYAKYHPVTGTAPPRAIYGLWGYDYLNIMRSAKFANDNGVAGTTYSAATYYSECVTDYLANYTTFAATDYDRIFINVIAAELGVGTFQGTVVWDDTQYGIQEAAYGLIGGSWDDPAAAKQFIWDNICTAGYSEPVAEAILCP